MPARLGIYIPVHVFVVGVQNIVDRDHFEGVLHLVGHLINGLSQYSSTTVHYIQPYSTVMQYSNVAAVQ